MRQNACAFRLPPIQWRAALQRSKPRHFGHRIHPFHVLQMAATAATALPTARWVTSTVRPKHSPYGCSNAYGSFRNLSYQQSSRAVSS